MNSQQRPQQQGMRTITSPDFSKLERFALMKLLKHYNINPLVGATHSELVSMVTKAFENTIVSEHDVLLKFTHNLIRPTDGSSKLKGGRHSRNYLDSEPAKIGEQVIVIVCVLVLYVCMYVCMYVYMYVCIYVFFYIPLVHSLFFIFFFQCVILFGCMKCAMETWTPPSSSYIFLSFF